MLRTAVQDSGSLDPLASALDPLDNQNGCVQDPGSLDPLASALARASGSSQRALDQMTRHGSNTSIASLAGSTASSLIPPPSASRSQPHSHPHNPQPATSAGSLQEPLSSGTPSAIPVRTPHQRCPHEPPCGWIREGGFAVCRHDVCCRSRRSEPSSQGELMECTPV